MKRIYSIFANYRPWNKRRRPTIRTMIALLVLACVGPAMLGLIVLIGQFYERERDQIRQETLLEARALVLAVDRDLNTAKVAGLALATSPSLAMNDLAALHAQALSLLGGDFPGFTFVLSDQAGWQRLNTLRPFGQPLARHGNPDQLRQVFETGKPVVSNLYVGGVLRKPLIGIDVPVWRDGRISYVLSVGILPESIGKVLTEQKVPVDRIVGIFDANGIIVARTVSPEKFVGQKGAPELLAAMQKADEGALETLSVEGIPVYSVFSRSPLSGWTVAVGIPKTTFLAEVLKTVVWTSCLVLALLASGLTLAWYLGGAISRSVKALASPEMTSGSGNPLLTLPMSFREGEEVASVLFRHRDYLQYLLDERSAQLVKLKVAIGEVESANNAKSRFLAAASHDLRQPLAALSLYIEVLKDKALPAQQALIASMHDCTTVLGGLLTDLLDLSKLEAGVVKPENSDFSVFEMLSDLESVFYLRAKSKGLRLHFRPTDLIGHSDPVLFRRMLGNFIDNAIRYTERGGIVVACRHRQGKYWIEVWDSGRGIAAEHTAEVFEEFKQLGDQARNQGSGLGLAIVAKTAALLGLEISLRSRPGHGSVFAIELPPGQREAVMSRSMPLNAYRPLLIALVDDNRLVRDALEITLQSKGHRVIAAGNGASLLSQLVQAPDIVVSDYRLADGETGYDVIAAVRAAIKADLPAILVTGDTDPQLIANMAERGVTVLHKPLDMAVFEDDLERLTTTATSRQVF